MLRLKPEAQTAKFLLVSRKIRENNIKQLFLKLVSRKIRENNVKQLF